MWWEKGQQLLQAPSKEFRELVLKRPQNSQKALRRIVTQSEGGVLGVCDQFVGILLIG